MRIYKISQNIKETHRQHGRTLPETGYKDRFVYIYRAVPKSVTTINNMDYVTRSRRFAQEHADHMAATTEEDQHVLSAFVEAKDVAEAYNPGEYFYIKEAPVNARPIYESKYEDI